MNKIACLIFIASSFALLSGCSTRPHNHSACKCFSPCMFPDTENDAAPKWVCEAKLEGFQISAVGVTPREKAVAGVSFVNRFAEEDARTQLVSRMQELAGNTIKNYFKTAGATVDQKTINKIMASVAQYISDKTLIGEKKLKRQISPAATTYVLLGMSSESVEKTTQKAIKTSMENEPELWLPFKTRKDLDDLVAKMVK